MARNSRERRRKARERWPLLYNVLNNYFGQSFEGTDCSFAAAMKAAASDGSTVHRGLVLQEWRAWNMSEGAVDDIRPFLSDGFGLDIAFESAIAGRKFMNRLYDEMQAGMKPERPKRKPIVSASN